MSENIPPSWFSAPIGEITTWSSGGTPSKSEPRYWTGEIPWVSPKDMKVFRLRDAQDHVSELGVAAGSRLAPKGSTLIVVRGMILAHTFPVCLTNRPMAFNQDVKAVHPGPTLDNEFLAYWFAGNTERLLALVTEATHGTKRLDLSDVQRVEVDVPPLPEQRRIAEVLDTVDEAIRKTEEVIAKLEQMKQGLLHDLLTRGIDENGELRDPERHPEQFKDSPLGRIPRGWEVGALANWLLQRPKNGYSPKQVDEWTGTVMLGLGCLTESGFRPVQLKNAPRDDTRLASALLEPGDLLVSRSNTRERVGLAGIYRDVGSPCIYPDLMMRLRPSSDVLTPYLEAVLLSPIVRSQIEAVAVGTSGSMVKINAKKVLRLTIPVPPTQEQGEIMTRLGQIEDVISEEEADVAKLRVAKRGLMDDLLTGRVRVNVDDEATG